MRIRLMGKPDEINAALPRLAAVFEVLETSPFYPNRGASVLGRVYVETGGVRAAPATASADQPDSTPAVEAGAEQQGDTVQPDPLGM